MMLDGTRLLPYARGRSINLETKAERAAHCAEAQWGGGGVTPSDLFGCTKVQT